MQLIEIVQLVLVGFIALSLIIFLFSYIGYRARNKKTDGNPIIPINEDKKSIESEKENNKNPVTKNELLKSIETKKKQSKFKVFNPAKDNSRSHNPKTIISSFLKESGKKK